MDKPLPDDFDPTEYLRGDMHQHNYGFGKFFELLMGGAMLLVVGLLCWLGSEVVSLGTDVAVLKDRPAPVSQDAFNFRMEAFERRLEALEQQR